MSDLTKMIPVKRSAYLPSTVWSRSCFSISIFYVSDCVLILHDYEFTELVVVSGTLHRQMWPHFLKARASRQAKGGIFDEKYFYVHPSREHCVYILAIVCLHVGTDAYFHSLAPRLLHFTRATTASVAHTVLHVICRLHKCSYSFHYFALWRWGALSTARRFELLHRPQCQCPPGAAIFGFNFARFLSQFVWRVLLRAASRLNFVPAEFRTRSLRWCTQWQWDEFPVDACATSNRL